MPLATTALVAVVGAGGGAGMATPCCSSPAPTVVLDAEPGRVPASYFGMHIHRATSTTAWPPVPFATWRLWDAGVSWWALQPGRSEWDWSKLDALVTLAARRRVELILTLGMPPRWASARPAEKSPYGPGHAAEPADMADWRRYVEAVVTRHAGRIRTFEIWNEPSVPSFFSGDVKQMVRLCREAYAIIKRADPDHIVVSPAPAADPGVEWLERFLDAGGRDCFDVVGFHFYVPRHAPERMVSLVAAVRGVLQRHGAGDRPIWNTEAGWYIVSKTPPKPSEIQLAWGTLKTDEAAAYLARALILIRAAGVARFYWYSWDNDWMGLAERDGSLKRAAVAYREVHRWLVGATLAGCRGGADGNWVCALVRPDRRGWIVWNAAGERRFSVPAAWKVGRRRTLLGEQRAVRSRSISVGPLPQLLETIPARTAR